MRWYQVKESVLEILFTNFMDELKLSLYSHNGGVEKNDDDHISKRRRVSIGKEKLTKNTLLYLQHLSFDDLRGRGESLN